MTWRLRIRHRTSFRYGVEVVASYNEARMTPVTDLVQTTLDARVQVAPTATISRYWDYWGSYVTGFDVHTPHRELTVEATSVVETGLVATSADRVDWPVLADTRFCDTYVEFLSTTARTAIDPELLEEVRAAIGPGSPDATAHGAMEWLRDAMEYVPGVTGVHTSAMQAWAERQGVCQDLAHLGVGLLRGLGIPARYVSGYLHPRAEAGIGDTVEGESHAWVEWWDGDWTACDPTNGRPVGFEHVVVARGRDYGDVPPHKGIYSGPPATALAVAVEVTRLA
jgi:transglutaminase-like putative cysteine protease